MLAWEYLDGVSGSYRVISIIAPDKTRTEIVKFDAQDALVKFVSKALQTASPSTSVPIRHLRTDAEVRCFDASCRSMRSRPALSTLRFDAVRLTRRRQLSLIATRGAQRLFN